MKTVSKSRASKSIVYDQHVLDYQDHMVQINAIMEEARIKAEENMMWAMIEPKSEPKQESKPRSSGTKIKVTVDDQSFDNLSAAMAHVNPAQWLKRNDYRDSCWTKINRKLKKDGVCIYDGHTYKMI